jgi:hypothetical protein
LKRQDVRELQPTSRKEMAQEGPWWDWLGVLRWKKCPLPKHHHPQLMPEYE